MPDVYYVCETMLHRLMDTGRVYVWSHVREDLPVAGVAQLAISTGSVSAREQHFGFVISATGAAKVTLYESSRGIFGGWDLAAINLVRPAGEQVDPPTRCVATWGFTYTEKGSILYEGLVPGATIVAVGGAAHAPPPWHLIPNENYMIEVLNFAAGAIDVGIVVTQLIEAAHTHATG